MSFSKIFLAITLLFCFSLVVFASTKIVVEDFEVSTAGKFPAGWKAHKDRGLSFYRVFEEGSNLFLRAEVKDDSVYIGKEEKFDSSIFKYVSWKWRAHKLPEGADERYKSKGDSCAAVSVLFPNSGLSDLVGIPKAIKYVWSSSLKKGTKTKSPYDSDTRVIVLETGYHKAGEWVSERVNVYQDYKDYFNEEPEEAMGIAILSDSDNTDSVSKADYDDITISTN